MNQRLSKMLAAVGISLLIAGCGGGGVIGAILGLIAVGDVIGDVTDLLDGGDDGTDVKVYFDGQPLDVQPSNGRLQLRGLPEGRHLLQVTSGSYEGAVTIVDVQPDADLHLGDLTPDPDGGGRIRGTVTVQEGDGSTHAAARTIVYAVPGGAPLVGQGAQTVNLPPAGTHYAAFTDGNGDYEIDAVSPGDYLVTAAIAGLATDVRLVQDLDPRETVDDVDLTLQADASQTTGRAMGTVAGPAGGGTRSLRDAALRASTAFTPPVPQDTIDRVAAASGAALRASPWFTWSVLSTLTDAGGSYELPLPSGAARIDCFSYDYRPAFRDVSVFLGGTVQADFDLEER